MDEGGMDEGGMDEGGVTIGRKGVETLMEAR